MNPIVDWAETQLELRADSYGVALFFAHHKGGEPLMEMIAQSSALQEPMANFFASSIVLRLLRQPYRLPVRDFAKALLFALFRYRLHDFWPRSESP